ncbi:MAG: hypothetical protein ACLU5E_01420 [Anaerovoracaceae bacterium]
MNLIYNGVDITAYCDISKCVHDMHAEGKADTLDITIQDTTNKWDSWGVKQGDEIEVMEGSVRSGKMYVQKTSQKDGFFRIVASSAPASAFQKVGRNWNDITFMQIGRDIAANHKLGIEFYDVEDRKYVTLQQKEESDLSFLHKRCILEGCAFLIFDQKIVIYSVEKRQETEAQKTLAISEQNEFELKTYDRYGLCTFRSGKYQGIYQETDGITYTPDFDFDVYDEAEANRYAKYLLMHANKYQRIGYRIEQEIAAATPGEVVNLSIAQAKGWNGKAFLYRVRNEYVYQKSKVFFRKVEE